MKKDNIMRMSEYAGKGPQFEFYSQIAKDFDSYVFAGFYEKIPESELQNQNGILCYFFLRYKKLFFDCKN